MTDNTDQPRVSGQEQGGMANLPPGITGPPDSPRYNPPSPTEQPYQLQSPPSEFRVPSEGVPEMNYEQYQGHSLPHSRNPLRTGPPISPIDNIGSEDVLRTNLLSRDNEVKFMSSRKGADLAFTNAPLSNKDIINDEKHLVEFVSQNSFIRPKYVSDNGMFINKEQAIDASIFTRFKECAFWEFLPEDFEIKARYGHSVLSFPIQIELLNRLNLPYHQLERNCYNDMLTLPTMFNIVPGGAGSVIIKSRSSMEHYPSYVSALALSKVTGSIDSSTTRAWQANFQLRSEDDATWLIKNRARTASVGDNHLYILVRALSYYMDAMWAQAKNVVVHTRKQSLAGQAYSIYHDTNWVSSVAEGGKEVVNCTDMDPDYAYFWTCCTLKMPEVLSSMTSFDGGMVVSPYGALMTQMVTPMCVISDHKIVHPRRAPTWFTQPQYMLSYIETYVDKFGLQQQLSEAYSIIQYLPIAKQLGLNVSLPEPIHSADWYENQVEAHETTTCTIALAGSHPMQLVASVSVMPLVISCSLYDLSCVLIQDRKTITPKKEEKEYIKQFWKRALSRGGAAMTFIFNKVLRAPLKAAHLCGWTKHIVDISPVLPDTWDDLNGLPLCIGMLQAVTSHSSIRSKFYEGASFSFTPSIINNLASIPISQFQSAWMLGIIKPSEMKESDMSRLKPIVPSLKYETAVTFRATNRTIELLKSSVADPIQITFRPPYALADQVSKIMLDPLDSDTVDNVWGFGGLETPESLLNRGGQFNQQAMNKVLDDESRVDDKAQAISDSILSRVIEKVEAQSNEANAAGDDKAFKWVVNNTYALQMVGFHPPSGSNEIIPSQNDPNQDDACGWNVLLTVLFDRGFICTRARIYDFVKSVSGCKLNRDRLSAAELALVLAVFDLPLTMVLMDTNEVLYFEDKFHNFSLQPIYLFGGHWSVGGISGSGLFHQPKQGQERCSVGEGDSGSLNSDIVGKSSLMSQSLMAWEHKLTTTEDLVELHNYLYPGRGVPRFILEALPVESPLDSTPTYERVSWDNVLQVVFDNLQGIKNLKLRECLSGKRRASVNWLIAEYMSEEATLSNYYFREPSTAKKHNVTLTDILECGVRTLDNQKFALVFGFCLLHTGQALEFVSSVSLWLVLSNFNELSLGALLSEKVLLTDEDKWIEVTKPLHDKWRKFGIRDTSGRKLDDQLWSQLLYLPSLFGRGGVEVDWQKEFLNKSKEPDNILMFTRLGWSATAAEDLIRVEMDKLVSTAYPKATPRSFDDFMDMAYEWLVSGSSAGLPSVLKDSPLRKEVLDEYGIQPRPTKRSVMEAIPREKVMSILETSPKVVSKAHMKLNETGGKARAIYGVSLWHYIFSNWLIAPVETHLKSEYIDINLPNSRFVELLFTRAHKCRQGAIFSSYDYPDFNSMHSHTNMSNLYLSAKNHAVANLKNEGKMSLGDRSIIARGFDWLVDSTFRQAVIHPVTGSLITTVGGLYSGNRDTTLLNTLLNVCYSKVVDNSMIAMGMSPGVTSRFCHGDDIITLFTNYPSAVAWNEVAEKCRLKGQETKLLTDCSYHEYLRVMGSPSGKLLGCLARSCATFTNGNWESDRTVGLGNKVREIFSNVSTLVRRGADKKVCEQLWLLAASRSAEKIKSLRAYKPHLINMLPLNKDEKQRYMEKKGLTGDLILTAGRKNRDEEIDYSKLQNNVTGPYMKKIIKSLPDWASVNKENQSKMMNVLQSSTYGTELPAGNQDVGMALSISRIPAMSYILPGDNSKLPNGIGSSDSTLKLMKGTIHGFDYKKALRIISDEAPNWRIKNRVKALFVVLQHCSIVGGHNKYELIGFLTQQPTHIVREVLGAEGWLENDGDILDYRDVPEVASCLRQFRWSYKLLTGLTAGEIEGFCWESDEGHTLSSRDSFMY